MVAVAATPVGGAQLLPKYLAIRILDVIFFQIHVGPASGTHLDELAAKQITVLENPIGC
jgi:hypothetical protein